MKTADIKNKAISGLVTETPEYGDMIPRRIKGGLPVLTSRESIHEKTLSACEPFGFVTGRPVSREALDSITPLQKFVINGVAKILTQNTAFTLIVTSHDRSRNGNKRTNSIGHSLGFATDFIFCVPEGDEDDHSFYPVVDLINSLAFLNYLRAAAIDAFKLISQIPNAGNGSPIIFGVEYDHLHIEWPWSDRPVPRIKGSVRLVDVPSLVTIGLFYNPQASYGLPPIRSGVEQKMLTVIS